VTSAYWRAGQYVAGAGALFIVADIDMIATTLASDPDIGPLNCLSVLCGADYIGMNSNAIFALNTFSFLQGNGGSPVAVPGTVPLAAIGLGLLALRRRRRV
jgi:MYXO-CTERM domain-containing protein